jgi:fatty acid desaturase
MSAPTAAEPRRLIDIDYDGFAAELFALKKRTAESLGPEDVRHLKKMIWINRLFTFVGYATAWIFPNPISAYFISQGLTGRWIMMHHISHGGYDAVPGVPRRYTSKVFAQGARRWIDWFDWILPAAWHFEHDVLHHCNTNERKDPDLVEDHTEFLRQGGYPRWARYIIVSVTALTWKYIYYAPNTLRCLEEGDYADDMKGLRNIIWQNILDIRQARVRKVWIQCYAPYALVSFVVLPLLFFPLGWKICLFVLINRLMAECITNVHTFCVITPNHAGDDLYRFDYHFQGKGEWCVNQVISSCNYACGTDTVDYFHGWLNYQIEHHLFPRFPMLKYQQIQPEVKAICERYNVPYVQESIVKRVAQLYSISVGHGSMKWLRDDPATSESGASDDSLEFANSAAKRELAATDA